MANSIRLGKSWTGSHTLGGSRVATQWEREQRKLQAEAEHEERESQVLERNGELDNQLLELDSILIKGVQGARTVDYESRLLPIPAIDSIPRPARGTEPTWADYRPKPPGSLARRLPGWQGRFEQKVDSRRAYFNSAHSAWIEQGERDELEYNKKIAEVEARAIAASTENDRLRANQAMAQEGRQQAVEDYVNWAMATSKYPFEVGHSLRYLPSRKELLLQVQFPNADVIPDIARWVHIKTRKAVEPKSRTKEDRNKRYKQLIAQVTLRTLYESFHVDTCANIDSVSFKGTVSGISPVTGYPVHPAVVSLRVERESFLDRDFLRVDAMKLLTSLRANISNEPTELKPVPLVVEFDVTDPRLIEEEDVLSKLDDRTNLIDLTPSEFEDLITNLFNAMGYKAKSTVRRKDGGVDTIAHYRDPVGYSKYIIQAKKWTRPVGVAAVRDLAGALDHERASKGILVTTSRIEPAGKKFAEGKPLTLIEGSELLDLFERYTDRRVTIVFPPK